MKLMTPAHLRRALSLAFILGTFAQPTLHAANAPAPTIAKPAVNAPVTITESEANWVLDNGIVKLTVAKNSGRLASLVYHGGETLNRSSEGWEQYPTTAATSNLKATITIDPAKNGGERAEVSVKGINEGTVFGTGVGGGTLCDLEVRYTLGKGESGFYTYQIFTHPANYPATTPGGESRYINQLTPNFDWLSVDADRNMLMVSNADTRTGVVVHAKEQRIISTGIYKNSVEHKYSYCALRLVEQQGPYRHLVHQPVQRVHRRRGPRGSTSCATWVRRCSITGCPATTRAACSVTSPRGRNGTRWSARFLFIATRWINSRRPRRPSWTRWPPRRATRPFPRRGRIMPTRCLTTPWPWPKRPKPSGLTPGCREWTTRKNPAGPR